MNEGPKLLVEWSSPWQEFVTSIRPAFGRSPIRLAGEAETGLFPVRGILLSWGIEAIFLTLLIVIPAKLASMRPYMPPSPPKYDVIYFSADELPQIQDRGGAQAGKSGRAGGKEAHHRSQTIRVARGTSAVEKVVDAPDLKLPVSSAPVANLLAFKSVPGPPPAEGLKSSRTAPDLSKNAIVAPPPEVTRERNRMAGLNSDVIAPPPTTVAQEKARQMMGLSTTIVAPAPQDVPRDQSRSLVAMNSRIIQPAPDDVRRDPPPLHGPASASAVVVPPPVSAPQRDTSQTAKLSLPTPGVVAPPPSQVTRDTHVSGASLVDPNVVPPPAEIGGRSQNKQALTGLIGANQVVPPPPSVTGGASLTGGGRGHNDKAGGFGSTLTGESVVPPPPSIAGDTTGSSRGHGSPQGSLGGGLGTNSVVPPPPNLSGPGGFTGRGTGSKGTGLGGPLDAGSVLAPATGGGANGGGKGVVVSSQPGSVQGVPNNGSAGVLAMSPGGRDKSGIGGSGGGTGIGHGSGPGGGLSGEGSGAAKEGSGRGSDPNAHGGISPYPGPGGSGSGTNGQPPIPGASVAGGSTNTITLPSFGGGDPDPGAMPAATATSKAHHGFGVSVFGTSRSGGAFNRYGQLPGDNYTIYIPTVLGTAVMQYADPASSGRPYSEKLTDPEPIRVTLPDGLSHSRLVVACVLGRTGMLTNIRVLEAGPQPMTSKVVAALYGWKFTPALHGNEPVEVNAFLGFNIDTR
jgi:hypothetical protein